LVLHAIQHHAHSFNDLDESIGVVLVEFGDGEEVLFAELELLTTGNQEAEDGGLAGIDVAKIIVGVVDLEGLLGAETVEDTGEGGTESEEDPELVDGVVGSWAGGGASLGVLEDFRVEVVFKVRDARESFDEVEAGLIERDDRVSSCERWWRLFDCCEWHVYVVVEWWWWREKWRRKRRREESLLKVETEGGYWVRKRPQMKMMKREWGEGREGGWWWWSKMMTSGRGGWGEEKGICLVACLRVVGRRSKVRRRREGEGKKNRRRMTKKGRRRGSDE
jgi:hypothetical protein